MSREAETGKSGGGSYEISKGGGGSYEISMEPIVMAPPVIKLPPPPAAPDIGDAQVCEKAPIYERSPSRGVL